MTYSKHRLPAAALGLAALLAPAARAQLGVIDVGAIAKAVERIEKAQEQIDKAQEQIDKTEELRNILDEMTSGVTDPWTELAAEASALDTSALPLPGALGTPPAPGGRLRARLDGTRVPLPSEPSNADLLAPPAATPGQITAAITPTAADDPLAGDAAARLARERQLRLRAEQRLAALRQRGIAQHAADAQLAGLLLNVQQQAAQAFATNEASADTTWTALLERNAAMSQTLGVLQSQLLALELAAHERAALQRQDSAARAAAARIAALQAAAASKARHRDYEANPARDGGDDTLEDCSGRFFTCGQALPPGF